MRYALVFLGFIGILNGCFSQRNEVIQKDALSYLLFSGPSEEVFFSVYKENTAVYENVEIQPAHRYSIVPGTYRVEVRHKGEVVTNRNLFFSDGQTQEIRLP